MRAAINRIRPRKKTRTKPRWPQMEHAINGTTLNVVNIFFFHTHNGEK